MGGITLESVTSQLPSISQLQALAACNDEAACLPGTPAISLELLTDTQAGVIQPDNSVLHSYAHRLVWSMTWSDPSCGPNLGPRRPLGHTAAPPAPVKEICDYLAFIDAASGHFLFAYDGPADASS
jgi:hypothetical protein